MDILNKTSNTYIS